MKTPYFCVTAAFIIYSGRSIEKQQYNDLLFASVLDHCFTLKKTSRFACILSLKRIRNEVTRASDTETVKAVNLLFIDHCVQGKLVIFRRRRSSEASSSRSLRFLQNEPKCYIWTFCALLHSYTFPCMFQNIHVKSQLSARATTSVGL